MNKSELVAKVAERAGVSAKDAESVVSSLFETVIESAKAGDKVAWPGFGTFQTKTRAAREGRNPQTGATISIPQTTVLHFGPAAALKTALN